jgi:hypothetical protein
MPIAPNTLPLTDKASAKCPSIHLSKGAASSGTWSSSLRRESRIRAMTIAELIIVLGILLICLYFTYGGISDYERLDFPSRLSLHPESFPLLADSISEENGLYEQADSGSSSGAGTGHFCRRAQRGLERWRDDIKRDSQPVDL